MRVSAAFSSNAVAGALRENFESLLCVHVRRVETPDLIDVATVELTSAEADDERPVDHGEHPAESVEEIDREIARLVEAHTTRYGAGLYHVELRFAKPPRGQQKKPVVVPWEAVSKEARDDETRSESRWLGIVKDFHAMMMAMGAQQVEMLGSMGRLWGDVARVSATLQERAITSASTSFELEALKLQQNGEKDRMEFASTFLRPILSRFAGVPGMGAPIHVEPKAVNGTPQPMAALPPKAVGLLERAHTWAQTITAEQRAKLTPPLLDAVRHIERTKDIRELLQAIKAHHERVNEELMVLVATLNEGQLRELERIVEMVLGTATQTQNEAHP